MRVCAPLMTKHFRDFAQYLKEHVPQFTYEMFQPSSRGNKAQFVSAGPFNASSISDIPVSHIERLIGFTYNMNAAFNPGEIQYRTATINPQNHIAFALKFN